MKHPSFKEYLIGMKPTSSGIGAVMLCLILLPLFADLFFLPLNARTGSITLTTPLLNSYLKAIPYYLLYLLVYFFILNTWNFITIKLKIEKFYFRS